MKTVYRFEHAYCADPGHGPHHWCRSNSYGSDIFGTAGYAPIAIDPDVEYCGVDGEEFPHWYGSRLDAWRLAEAYRDGWRFVKYRVPKGAWRHDTGQTLFKRALSERVCEVELGRLPKPSPDDARRHYHKRSYDLSTGEAIERKTS